jgi:hypothetical protein
MNVDDVLREAGFQCPLCGAAHMPAMNHASAALRVWEQARAATPKTRVSDDGTGYVPVTTEEQIAWNDGYATAALHAQPTPDGETTLVLSEIERDMLLVIATEGWEETDDPTALSLRDKILALPPVPFVPDSTEHRSDATCWCHPVKSYEDPATGTQVWSHRDDNN